jgi:hypothetical protein
VSVHTPALQPAPIFAAPEPISRSAGPYVPTADRITPIFRGARNRLHPVSSGPTTNLGSIAEAESSECAPDPELALAAARPFGAAVIVARYTDDHIEHGTCALCWTGPAPMAGSVRRRDRVFAAGDAAARNICSRCLVTLEMLAVQFDTELQLHIETPA